MPSLGCPLSLAEKRAFQLSTLSLGGAKGREAFGDSIRVERETLRVQNLMHSLSPSISLSLAPHSQLFRTPPPELKASKLPPLRRLLLVSRSASNGSIASEEASELANGEVGEHFSAKVEPPSPPPRPPHIISAVPLPFPLCLARYALSDRRSSRLSSCSFLLRERGKRRGPL